VIVAVVRFPMDPSQPADAVRSSFEASAPAYQSITGLLRKHFLRAEDGSEGGGVYLWDSRAAAEAWYTDAWRERLTQKFGAAPAIEYFESPVTVDADGVTVA
jgi:heme-degrading monooxygenase HmoA